MPPGFKVRGLAIIGVPRSVGRWPVRLADERGQRSAPLDASLEVLIPDPSKLRIMTLGLPAAVVGKRDRVALSAEGGTGGYSWSVSGELPRGLVLAKGSTDGTPQADGVGEWELSLTVTDEASMKAARKVPFSVGPAWPELAIEDINLGEARVLRSVLAMLHARACFGRCLWSLERPVPGLRVDEGLIRGTPGRVGRYAIALLVRDDRGREARKLIELSVVP